MQWRADRPGPGQLHADHLPNESQVTRQVTNRVPILAAGHRV
jgi:hypothetical protein